MKTFKNLISEVAQPKAGDEKAFKDKHIVTKVGHPVALDHQFTGEIPGTAKLKRRADLAPGEDASVYEAIDPVDAKALKGKHKNRKDKDIDNDGDVDDSDEYLHKRRKAISKAIAKEEVELSENPMEEKPMMMNTLRSMSHNVQGIARYVQSTQDPEEWFQNKLAGVAKEMQTLYSYATAEVMSMGEEAEIDEAKSSKKTVKISQKTITRALQGMKVQPKGKVSLKKAPWDKSEEAEIDEDLNEKFATGMVKFKDGSSVILKKQDADLLNQMFKDLSSTNRKKMQSTAMADKSGFEEILGFAREAM